MIPRKKVYENAPLCGDFQKRGMSLFFILPPMSVAFLGPLLRKAEKADLLWKEGKIKFHIQEKGSTFTVRKRRDVPFVM